MIATLEELLSKHFRRPAVVGYVRKPEPGLVIEAADAARFCDKLTPRQRAGVDAETLAALDLMLDEALEIAAPHGRIPNPKAYKAFGWFKARRAPGLERT